MTYQALAEIHTVVIHCAATRSSADIGAAEIDQWHKARGWSGIGYHRVIRRNGGVENGRMFTQRGAHVAGNNTNTIGICMVGGVGDHDIVEDNFTPLQWISLEQELRNAITLFPNLKKICGHRDYSPDLNGDGLITPNEWTKGCPSFEVSQYLHQIGLDNYV